MKKIFLSTLAASLLYTTGIYAKETAAKDATVKQVNAIAMNNAKEAAKDSRNALVKEAIASLKYAHEALVALNKKEAKSATDALEKALGKLEVIMAAKDAPKVLPVDSVVRVYEYVGTSDSVKMAIKMAKELLDDYKVQEARALLLPLKSEIDVTVASLPLATYPDALKLAAKYIHDNKIDKAKAVLSTALSTFVETTTVIPVPLLNATDLVEAARVAESTDTKRAQMYLEAAQEELKTAHYLGYVSHSSVTYKVLDDLIDKTKRDITAKEIKETFKELQEKLKDFSAKVFSSKEKKEKK